MKLAEVATIFFYVIVTVKYLLSKYSFDVVPFEAFEFYQNKNNDL